MFPARDQQDNTFGVQTGKIAFAMVCRTATLRNTIKTHKITARLAQHAAQKHHNHGLRGNTARQSQTIELARHCAAERTNADLRNKTCQHPIPSASQNERQRKASNPQRQTPGTRCGHVCVCNHALTRPNGPNIRSTWHRGTNCRADRWRCLPQPQMEQYLRRLVAQWNRSHTERPSHCAPRWTRNKHRMRYHRSTVKWQWK